MITRGRPSVALCLNARARSAGTGSPAALAIFSRVAAENTNGWSALFNALRSVEGARPDRRANSVPVHSFLLNIDLTQRARPSLLLLGFGLPRDTLFAVRLH